jgi:hypothetical protein
MCCPQLCNSATPQLCARLISHYAAKNGKAPWLLHEADAMLVAQLDQASAFKRWAWQDTEQYHDTEQLGT